MIGFIVVIVIMIIVFANAKNSNKNTNKNSNTNINTKINTTTRANTNINTNPGKAAPRPNGNIHMTQHIPVGTSDDGCTTGFLLNKSSHFNENEHPRLDKGVGIIAMRHEDWMNVYNGNKVVKCCYCGAYNQVPARKNGEYKCYFCWKKL